MGEVEAVKHLTEEQLVSHYYGELDNLLEAVKHFGILRGLPYVFCRTGQRSIPDEGSVDSRTAG
jgi:hypothetical protein